MTLIIIALIYSLICTFGWVFYYSQYIDKLIHKFNKLNEWMIHMSILIG
jgi:Tfp pilus assembly protein PilO